MSSPDNQSPPARSDEDLRRDGVVHDVNQMLSVITGRAACLMDGQPDGDLRRGLDSILRAARDAAVILKRLGPSPQPAGSSGDLRLRVTEALATIRPPDQSAWSGAGSEATWRADNQVPAGLQAAVPAVEVREVLQNLLVNALAVMPAGGLVTVTGEAVDGRVRIRVADSGPGVAEADDERIFAAGYTTSGDQGRGVGLAASRQLLARHEAMLALGAAEPGEGAVFVMDLPPGQATALPEPVGGTADDLGSLEILVVEDEPAVRDLFRDLLGAWRCAVTLAPDAETVRGDFTPGRYRVALVDWTLPGEQGLELADWLRSQDPALAVILTTGMDRERELAGLIGQRVDFTLVKPLDLDELRRTLAGAATLAAARSAGAPKEES